jgi:hypothetical protein
MHPPTDVEKTLIRDWLIARAIASRLKDLLKEVGGK